MENNLDDVKTTTVSYTLNPDHKSKESSVYLFATLGLLFAIVVGLQVFTLVTLRQLNSVPTQEGKKVSLAQGLVTFQQPLLATLSNQQQMWGKLLELEVKINSLTPNQSVPPVQAQTQESESTQ